MLGTKQDLFVTVHYKAFWVCISESASYFSHVHDLRIRNQWFIWTKQR